MRGWCARTETARTETAQVSPLPSDVPGRCGSGGAAAGDVDAGVLRDSRAWTPQQWGEAVQSLRERGWLDDGPDLALTEERARRRAEIEHTTDRLAALPYLTLGPTACAELSSLARPFSLALAKELLRGRSPA
ncbi:hypothetical protein [Streptomyces sp. NPDC012616]|uniref:helix-turn-helix domain-containing protein n=1 Tax=Streptomyces sp. NPDC012616 TaxID=3364840 RepID=UPI0036EB9C8B